VLAAWNITGFFLMWTVPYAVKRCGATVVYVSAQLLGGAALVAMFLVCDKWYSLLFCVLTTPLYAVNGSLPFIFLSSLMGADEIATCTNMWIITTSLSQCLSGLLLGVIVSTLNAEHDSQTCRAAFLVAGCCAGLASLEASVLYPSLLARRTLRGRRSP
jgi:hypothetical protein